VASAVPLGDSSIPYKFCFVKPSEDNVMDLQRKRAAALAEKALENTSGCARTEGLSAVDKSSGSGRITRALVRQANEDTPNPSKSTDGTVGGKDRISESKQDLESNQAKYDEMKSVSMERRLAAKRSHIHGWGLFAKRDYPKHSMIAEYMGETVRQPIADKREKEYEVLGMGSCYMFRLDMQHIVDATRIGCMARFMNHCCAANAYAKIVTVSTELGLEKKIVVFANQDINAGDEITYDYKFPVEDGSLRCTCGAPNCIGRMN
jgi:histone-lysine N-methyltransferase SETD1